MAGRTYRLHRLGQLVAFALLFFLGAIRGLSMEGRGASDGPEPDAPALHGPRVVGTTPGRPFLFRIPATGAGALTFSAQGLPPGLTLDPRTGILSGALRQSGEWRVRLAASGAGGRAERVLTIIGGDHALAQTPPMGWNSWNVWGTAVDAEKVRQAADALVSSGLAAHGYQYVIIDDGWAGERDAEGRIQPQVRFGDIAALASYVHARGLKLGLYSSPGPRTCGGFAGSYQHEAQDAQTWAAWGVDYLKYDWCSYGQLVRGERREDWEQPYRLMGRALAGCGRDIVYSISQYGKCDVWEWGAAAGGNLWRTTDDITDSWDSVSRIGFDGGGPARSAGPGHWNDPDMLVVGRIGWGQPRPTNLTPDEQRAHFSLWCLQAAPLLLGCDLTQLDDFTHALLTNDEVLDVDQDPLGRQGERVARDGTSEVWAKTMWDGTLAVGLFNRGEAPAEVEARWPDLNLSGPQPVRDLWQRRDLGTRDIAYHAAVPPHGVILVRIGHPGRMD